jgi:hypothetical protein
MDDTLALVGAREAAAHRWGLSQPTGLPALSERALAVASVAPKIVPYLTLTRLDRGA